MSLAIHRTTNQVLKSVDTLNLDPNVWLINPDTTNVEAVPTDRWFVEGNTVRPATDAEIAARDTAILNARKAVLRQAAVALMNNPNEPLAILLKVIVGRITAEIRAIKAGTPLASTTDQQLFTEIAQLILSGAGG